MWYVSVGLSVSVESATECRIGDNDVLCAVSLSDAMWSAMSVLLEKLCPPSPPPAQPLQSPLRRRLRYAQRGGDLPVDHACFKKPDTCQLRFFTKTVPFFGWPLHS